MKKNIVLSKVSGRKGLVLTVAMASIFATSADKANAAEVPTNSNDTVSTQETKSEVNASQETTEETVSETKTEETKSNVQESTNETKTEVKENSEETKTTDKVVDYKQELTKTENVEKVDNLVSEQQKESEDSKNDLNQKHEAQKDELKDSQEKADAEEINQKTDIKKQEQNVEVENKKEELQKENEAQNTQITNDLNAKHETEVKDEETKLDEDAKNNVKPLEDQKTNLEDAKADAESKKDELRPVETIEAAIVLNNEKMDIAVQNMNGETINYQAIEWIKTQIFDATTPIGAYFKKFSGANQSLDSTGYNYAPDVNKNLIENNIVKENDKFTYRIYMGNSNQYNIFWKDGVDIADNDLKDKISNVTKYESASDNYYLATVTLGTKTTDKKDAPRENITFNVINGTSFDKSSDKINVTQSVKAYQDAKENSSKLENEKNKSLLADNAVKDLISKLQDIQSQIEKVNSDNAKIKEDKINALKQQQAEEIQKTLDELSKQQAIENEKELNALKATHEEELENLISDLKSTQSENNEKALNTLIEKQNEEISQKEKELEKKHVAEINSLVDELKKLELEEAENEKENQGSNDTTDKVDETQKDNDQNQDKVNDNEVVNDQNVDNKADNTTNKSENHTSHNHKKVVNSDNAIDNTIITNSNEVLNDNIYDDAEKVSKLSEELPVVKNDVNLNANNQNNEKPQEKQIIFQTKEYIAYVPVNINASNEDVNSPKTGENNSPLYLAMLAAAVGMGLTLSKKNEKSNN